ncbi:GIY-YIG nuclease family protein [Streptomyces sp. ID05-04B]|uniref:GIY-YIG nuclease family protein n=1 Tax=Streptomyces sp. ID05-04B TaxID=3028661 RepID=UPI0029CAA1A2|nr:GIY-YIG nuclease family protein [Streptomyces sp. ID05-04B]
MPEPTVRCACGRTMTPDSPRGRGHYRCGCGHRIHVTIPAPRRTQCAVPHRGEPCRLTPVIAEPLLLCEQHYAETGLKEYHSWVNGTPEEIDKHISKLVTRRVNERWERHFPAGPLEPAPTPDLEPYGVVYFIRSQDLVKVGTTLHLLKRMASFSVPHITLLATEPGYRKRERELHLRFADLRVSRREWFRLEPPLTDYINTIRDQHGLPAVAA